MKHLTWLLVFTLMTSSLVSGQDSPEAHVTEDTPMISDQSELSFCFDPSKKQGDAELMKDFETLFSLGLLDRENCIIKERRNKKNEALVKRFIERNVNDRVNVYGIQSLYGNRMNLLLTNSDDENYVQTALTTRDKWEVVGLTAGSIVLGTLVSEKVYRGQADKRKHVIVGATVSGLTTGTTYFLIEGTSFGKKLNLSAKAKKNVILFSGPVVGTVLGIMKEVYDSKHKSKHTTDPHDAAATSLGAGIGVFAINFVF